MLLKLKSFIVPLSFIMLSGAGFVFIKMGLSYSSSMAFLELRYLLAFVVLLLVAFIFKAKFPKSLNEIFHIRVLFVATWRFSPNPCVTIFSAAMPFSVM